jgi:hypothetical protein
MSYKIEGPALCGFADHFDGVGAAPKLPSAKPGKVKGKGKPKPVAPKPYPKVKTSATIAEHAKVLKHARQVLAKSHGKVKVSARKTLARPVAPQSRMAVPRTRVAVQGDGYVIVGAPPPPAQTQRQREAKVKLENARKKLAVAKEKVKKATQVAAAKTKQAHGTLQHLAAQVKSHENVARKLSGRGGGKKVTVHGLIGSDANGLLPGDPGYDPTTEDGTDGPAGSAYASGGDYADPSLDPTTGAPVNPQLDVETLVAAANAAPVPIDAVIVDATQYPVIMYDGSKGTPDGFLLSLGLATRSTDLNVEPDTAQIEGNAHFGYVFGKYDKKNPANGGVGWGSHLASGQWNHVHGRYYLGDDSWWNPVSVEEACTSASHSVDPNAPGANTGGAAGWEFQDYANKSYGPLVGNPVMSDFKGMRGDTMGRIFWMANEAPDWATAPLKAAAALTKAAADKAQKDADAAAAAAAAKAAADAAAAQAAQDAQNALDEANAASQANQAAYQSDAAQYQTDAQYAQVDVQQQQQDLAERQQAAQQQQAEWQMEQQYAQQQMAQQQPQLAPDQGSDYAAPPPALPPGNYDDGGSPADDDTAFTPESDSDLEAAMIDTAPLDEEVIGGDGEVIGLDEYGNVTD